MRNERGLNGYAVCIVAWPSLYFLAGSCSFLVLVLLVVVSVNDFIDFREAAPELGSALFPADEGIMRLVFSLFLSFSLCPGIQTRLILSIQNYNSIQDGLPSVTPPALPCNL